MDDFLQRKLSVPHHCFNISRADVEKEPDGGRQVLPVDYGGVSCLLSQKKTDAQTLVQEVRVCQLRIYAVVFHLQRRWNSDTGISGIWENINLTIIIL